MVGGCGILLERGVVGGDGMLDWEVKEREEYVEYVCMYECIQYLFLESCNIWGII